MAHIRKRGKTYSYTIDLGKDPVTGKRKQINKGGFLKKKDAEAAARKIEIALDEKTFIEPSNELFNDFAEKWFFEHYQSRINKPTIRNRRYVFEKHILKNDVFSDKKLSDINTADIDAFYNQKINAGFSTSYIRQMHQLLNQSFSQAVKWGKLLSNPVAAADPPSVKYAGVSIWSIDEVHRFLKTCVGEHHYITFLLAIYTGMRRGEVIGLKWEDINFEEKVIFVNRALAYVPQSGFIFTSLKTKSSRRKIPVPDFVMKALAAHKRNQDEWRSLTKGMYQDHDLVICTNTGTMQCPHNLVRTMKRLIKQSGVTEIRFHDIRHTHASILIAEGVDIVKISDRLGHANPKVTMEFYAHLLPNSHNELADIFHQAVNKKKID